MYVIGERINGMFNDVKAGIRDKDAGVIKDLAKRQVDGGANAIDINVGPASAEPAETIKWLVEAVQEVTDVPIVLDSSNPKVIESGMAVCERPVIINSTTGQDEKIDQLMPLAVEHNADIIGLTMDDRGVPGDAERRAEIALNILAKAMEYGLSPDRLFIDPIILPCNVAQPQAGHVLETIRNLKLMSDPPPRSVLGLSNVSQGTKERNLINRVYAVMAVAAGLDAAILDPMDSDLMDAVITAELLLNKHIYCDSFLQAYRA